MQTNLNNDDFHFWMPVEVDIEKAGSGEEAVEKMIIKGIASTDDKDVDDQTLLNDGFDLSYLLERGFINWHHQVKNSPAAIIGEPIEAHITKKGLFVKGELYNTPLAKETFALAETLQKQSKRRRLGWSIEGKAIERAGNIIKKARINNIALTPAPKNKNTYAEVVKAMTDGDNTEQLIANKPEYFDNNEIIFETNDGTITINNGKVHYLQKSINAASHAPILARESLEGGMKLTRQPQVINRILEKYPDISLDKAFAVFNKIKIQKGIE